jgi:hypothetical protein
MDNWNWSEVAAHYFMVVGVVAHLAGLVLVLGMVQVWVETRRRYQRRQAWPPSNLPADVKAKLDAVRESLHQGTGKGDRRAN